MHRGSSSPVLLDDPERRRPHGRRSATRSRISHETIVTGSLADALWAEYYEAFAPLEELALLCHLYSRETFDSLLQNREVTKIVGWQDDRPVGLSMVTNHLELVPQISPKFLRKRYPEQAERNAIYFAIMLFVSSRMRARTLFARLSMTTCQLTAEHNGVIVMDVSDHILKAHGWESKLRTIESMYHGANLSRIDAQTYWAISLPEPLADDFRLAQIHRPG